MSDPVTPYAGLTKPTVGADNNAWGDLLNADIDLIDSFLRQIVPSGVMWDFAGASAPTGFLLCNGQAVSRTTYADLFAVIGTTYGIGDGSTTFNVPNAVDRFTVGAGNLYALAVTGGAVSITPAITVAGHALTISELPSHNHNFADNGHGHGVSDPGHAHGLTDPGHGHAVSDPGHAHSLGAGTAPFLAYRPGGAFNQSGASFGDAITNTDVGGSNISINGSTTGISVNGAATSVSVAAGSSNITFSAQGGGSSHTHSASSNAVATLPPYLAATKIIKT